MQNIDLRKKLEKVLSDLTSDFQRYRQSSEDSTAQDHHEIQSLSSHLKDLKFQYEDTHLMLQHKSDEAANLGSDNLQWQDHADRVTSENKQLRDVIEDLEDKNRRLVDKLNQQILSRVTEYKEKALQALTRSDSPGKLRRVTGSSDARLT